MGNGGSPKIQETPAVLAIDFPVLIEYDESIPNFPCAGSAFCGLSDFVASALSTFDGKGPRHEPTERHAEEAALFLYSLRDPSLCYDA
jgi:hypothetical protein